VAAEAHPETAAMSEPTPPAPAADAAPPSDAPPTTARPEYEFDDEQNKVIDELAMAIVWVRLPLLITGLLEALIATGLAFRLPYDGAHIFGVLGHALAAVVCFLLANWLMRAATAFARITATKGRDISHLMTGLKNLGAWFDLLAFFVKLYLFLLGLLLVLLVIGHLTGAFQGPDPVSPFFPPE
jgi:hypothetical protein